MASGRVAAVVGDITSVTQIQGSLSRTSSSGLSRTITFAGSYASDRWLIGLVMRQGTGLTCTIDSVTPTFLHDVTLGTNHMYRWFVAQPTGATATNFTTFTDTGVNPIGWIHWEVRSPTQPAIQYTADVTVAAGSLSLQTVASGGAAMGATMQANSAVPTNGFGITAPTGTPAGGWYWYTGGVYPTTGANLGLDPVANYGSAITLI